MNVESTYYDGPSTSGQTECPRISQSPHPRASSSIRDTISESSTSSHVFKEDTTLSPTRSLSGMREFMYSNRFHGAGLQLLAGGMAGAIQGMKNPSGKALKPPSILEEASRIAREEGLRAFWKGNTVTILHRLPYSAINFFAFENYKAALSDFTGASNNPNETGGLLLSMGVKLVAGGSAGVTAASITYPLDLVRTRLAAQTKSKYYNGVFSTLKTIVKDEGLRGLYKGMGATLLCVSFASRS